MQCHEKVVGTRSVPTTRSLALTRRADCCYNWPTPKLCKCKDARMTKSAKLLLPAIRKAIARLPGAPVNVKSVAVDLTAVPQSADNSLTLTALLPLLRALFERQADWHWVI